MIKFIFFATSPELFSQEISHIKSLLLTYNSEWAIITDKSQLVLLAPELNKESSVVILFASSDKELEDLLEIKESFGAIPTVLVLPNDNTMTLQRGMMLHPLNFMAKHSGLNQYSVAVSEIYNIYEDHFHQKRGYSSYH